MDPDKGIRPLRSYGRTRSRSLKPLQARRMDEQLPGLAIRAEDIGRVVADAGAAPVFLEIGFGGGEHLAAQARARPEALHIGAEPFQNGVASLVGHVEALRLGNVRIYPGDVRELFPGLPEGRLAGIYVLFPDPWPKVRHHKRRLLSAETIGALTRMLAPGGRLRFATDWADYAEAALLALKQEPELAWSARRADDWRKPWPDHFATRYEAKKLGDMEPLFFEFTRRVRG